MRQANGGLYEKSGFYISGVITNVTNIAGAEFFIDNDPGAGNATPVSVPAGAISNFVAIIPSTSLSNGFHFVAIRTKDTDGKWGLFEKTGFFISASTTNVSNIVAAEYL